MPFSSLLFLLYFLPIAVGGYHALRFSLKAQNIWLLLASLVFYAWGNPVYVVLLALMIVCNYTLARLAAKAKNMPPRTKRIYTAKAADKARPLRWVLVAAGVVNTAPLLAFRYLPSLVASMDNMTGWALDFDFPPVPLGIAFVALQGISYVVDTWRQKVELEKNIINCALYITFFPTLWAGPILRYHEMAAQIRKRTAGWQDLADGLCRFLCGLAKYVLIAQPLSSLVNTVFNQSNLSGTFTTVPAATALLGLIAYALQLYHQLSGFSDMALGLGRMFGFHLPENFDYPVMALSVTNFWGRAYRSWMAWFGEYVAQPLMSKKANRDHHALSTLVMWFAMCFWIGPGISNLVFAAWNYVLILGEQIVEFETSRRGKVFRHIYVAVTMLLGLSALKTQSIYEFALFAGNLFGVNNNGFANGFSLVLLREFWPMLALGMIFLFPVGPWLKKVFAPKGIWRGFGRALYPVLMTVLAALAFIVIVRTSHNTGLVNEYMLWSTYYG